MSFKLIIKGVIIFVPLFSLAQNKCTIEAETPFLNEGTKIYISVVYPYKPALTFPVVKASVYVVDHHFKMSLPATGAELYEIKVYSGIMVQATKIFLKPGHYRLYLDSLLKDLKVLNSKTNSDYRRFNYRVSLIKPPDRLYMLHNLYKQALSEKDTISAIAYYSGIDSFQNWIKEEEYKIALNYVKENPRSSINSYLIKQYIYQKVTDEETKLLFNKLSNSARQNSWGKELEYSFTNLLIGKYLPDFLLPDISGTVMTIDHFKGKYLFIDFWASWCLPCREQSKPLMELKKRFENKNFEIIYISLDENRARWLKAIEEDSLSSTNLSDLKGFDGVAKKYQIKSIPANFLVDPKGVIIGKNIELGQLEDILSLIFR